MRIQDTLAMKMFVDILRKIFFSSGKNNESKILLQRIPTCVNNCIYDHKNVLNIQQPIIKVNF